MRRERLIAGSLDKVVNRFGIGAGNASAGMKIVIAGAAKSGTTALYYALKQSLPRSYAHKFEPKSYVSKPSEDKVLAKIIINSVERIEDFDCFDKRVYLIRDPRDIVVSGVLYRIYNAREPIDQDVLDYYLRGIEQKQRDPASISVIELQKRLSPLLRLESHADHHRERTAMAFGTEHPEYFVYQYEDLIAGRFGELEKYLGFPITFSGDVDAKHQRVARAKEAGGWRNWFTPADVEYYRPLFQDFLTKYDYELDWTLNPNPRITAEHSTVYVRRMLAEGQTARRKAKSGLRARFKSWRHSLRKS
jgi:hypothetical protein